MPGTLDRILDNPPEAGGAAAVGESPLDRILANPPVGPGMPTPRPRETPEEAGKRAREAFELAADSGISLEEAERSIAAAPAAEPTPAEAEPLPEEEEPKKPFLTALWHGLAKGTVDTARRAFAATPQAWLDRLKTEEWWGAGTTFQLLIKARTIFEAERALAEWWVGHEIGDPLPDVEKIARESIQSVYELGLNRWAADKLQKTLDEHPEWEPQKIDSVKDLLVNPSKIAEQVVATLPYMAMTMGTMAFGGPAAAFAVTKTLEGQDAYEEAITAGASEEEAHMMYQLVGTINGLVELAQVGRLLKFIPGAKGALREMAKGVAKREVKRVLSAGGKLTANVLRTMAEESVEEAIQGTVQELGAKAVYGKAVEPGFWTRRGVEAVVAAAATPILGGGGVLIKPSAVEARRLRVDERVAMPLGEMPVEPQVPAELTPQEISQVLGVSEDVAQTLITMARPEAEVAPPAEAPAIPAAEVPAEALPPAPAAEVLPAAPVIPPAVPGVPEAVPPPKVAPAVAEAPPMVPERPVRAPVVPKAAGLAAKLARRDKRIAQMVESRTEAAKSAKSAIKYIKDVFKGELDEKGKQLQERLINIAESVRPETAERRLERLRAAVDKAQKYHLFRQTVGKVAEQFAFLRKNVSRMDEPYRAAAQEYLGTYEVATPTEQTLGRLKSREDWLARNPEMEVLMPPRVLKELTRLTTTPLRSLEQEDLDDLSRSLDLLIALNETKLELKVGRHRRNLINDIRQATREIQEAHDELPPSKRGEVGKLHWLFKSAHPDALRVARVMGGDEGVLTEYMVRGLWEAERNDNHWHRTGLEPLIEFFEGKDLRWASPKWRRALGKAVTVKLPTARGWETGRRVSSITLTADELVDTVLQTEDVATRREIINSGFCWDTQPKGRLTRPGRQDEKLVLTEKDMGALGDALTKGGWRSYADLLQGQFNNDERWTAQDAVKFALTGKHLAKTERYCPRSRNLRRERRRAPKGWGTWGEFMEFMLERGGPWQSRTGSSAAVVSRPATARYLGWLTFTSKAIARAEPIRNAWLMLAHRDVRTEIVRRFGEDAINHLESHLKNITGAGLMSHYSTVDQIISEATNRVASAAIRLRFLTSIPRQPISTELVIDVLGAKNVAKGTAIAYAHPLRTFREVMANSDHLWQRYHSWRTSALVGALGEPGPRYPKVSWMDMPLRWGDFAGINSLWESVKVAHPDWTLDAVARETERLINEEAAAPTFSDTYMSELQRTARRNPWIKTFTLFKNLTNRIYNKMLSRAQDVVRSPGSVKAWKALLYALVTVLGNAFVAMGLIPAGADYLISLGKRKPTYLGVILDTIEGALGSIYGVGDAVAMLKRAIEQGTSYGLNIKDVPALSLMTMGVDAVFAMITAVDALVEGDKKVLEKLARAGYYGTMALFYYMGWAVAPLQYVYTAARSASEKKRPSRGRRGAGRGGSSR